MAIAGERWGWGFHAGWNVYNVLIILRLNYPAAFAYKNSVKSMLKAEMGVKVHFLKNPT